MQYKIQVTNILPGFPNTDGLWLYRALYRDAAGVPLVGLVVAHNEKEAATLARRDAARDNLAFDQIEK